MGEVVTRGHHPPEIKGGAKAHELTKARMREKITALMHASMEHDQLDMPPKHLFCPGMYCRVLEMPAGAVIVSKLHKLEHFVVVLKGSASVVMADGKVRRVTAPRLMVTKPGTQRALIIHEDSTWAAFYPTDETNIDKLEDDIIAKDWDDPLLLEHFKEE